MLTCARCDAVTEDTNDLARHLVEFHFIAAARAQREAKEAAVGMTSNLPPTNGDLLKEEATAHHDCPKCGARVTCDWRAVALLDYHAHRLKIIAGMWRAKLLGNKIGRPRIHEIDEEQARALVSSGMSYRAVAKLLNVHPMAVHRAVSPDRQRLLKKPCP